MKEKENVIKTVVLIVAILVVFGIAIYSGFNYLGSKPLSYITIDINPSVELVVNSDNKVEDVISLNEDGDIITSDLDLIGLSVEEASEKIVQAAIDTGYVDELSDENTIVITSSSDDEDRRTELEEKVINRVDTHLNAKKVYALVTPGLTDELKTEADGYDISYGKMLLVNKAVILDPTLSVDTLVTLSIKEIQKEIKDSVKARIAEKKAEHEQLINEWKTKKQEKIELAKDKIEQKREELWNDAKNSYKNATTEQKKEIVNDLIDKVKTTIKNKVQERKGNR